MPVTFGREIINREVHDSADDRLGSVTDFTIDKLVLNLLAVSTKALVSFGKHDPP